MTMATSQNNVGGIGTIKYFDRAKKRGMIARESAAQSKANELYFEVEDDSKALKLHEGQLVQFVMQETDLGLEATEIEVLSDKA
jgi:cold shock CspA family protein